VKERIKERARELGFDDCRFTSAEPPHTARHFARWIVEGRQGTMGYLERGAAKRSDPEKILGGVKSIITLATSYHVAGHEPSPSRPGSASLPATRLYGPENADVTGDFSGNFKADGIIARYARFADYHEILGERLDQLSQFLDASLNLPHRSLWYVDTGPILERDLAMRSGIGFIGKHTNVISRRLGNWIFLSEILTTAEFEPDEPEKNRCGSCSRCISACPTEAITAPFKLDARRCISYLTIELKGAIPVELRPAIGNRIYGCDDCLAACPWNRFASEGSLMKAHSQPGLGTVDLIELLSITDSEFKGRFAGTPMLRTKRKGMLRNVCVALGNIGDERALPALERASIDPEPLIAEHARWASEQITTGCPERGRSAVAE
jgi:epoxyqueuosine reductase